MNISPTIPKSAILKIGASGFLLIATMVLLLDMPARSELREEVID